MFSCVMLAVTKLISINKFLSFCNRKEPSHGFRRLIEAARKRYSEKKVSRKRYTL